MFKLKLIIAILLFTTSCTSELTLVTTQCYTNQTDTINFKAKKSICLATFNGDTTWKLVDSKNRIIKDSVCDFKVLKH